MEKVYQDKFGKGEGNCWAACVASMLELPIEIIPDFNDHTQWPTKKNWFDRFQSWLQENFNMTVVQFHTFQFEGIYIAGGKSKRGIQHAVIYHGNQMIHDPHPDGSGLVEIEEKYVFIPHDISISLLRHMFIYCASTKSHE